MASGGAPGAHAPERGRRARGALTVPPGSTFCFLLLVVLTLFAWIIPADAAAVWGPWASLVVIAGVVITGAGALDGLIPIQEHVPVVAAWRRRVPP
jgi:hypothetical protein